MAVTRFGIAVFVMFTIVACNSAAPSTAQPMRPLASRTTDDARPIRQAILEELRPVGLKNCALKRYGSTNDGGYLLCQNLIAGLEGLYSYGIDAEDNFGCQVSTEFRVPAHQYDCFTDRRPTCRSVSPVFHDECVGPKAETIGGQAFATLSSQIAKNGHAGKRVLVKVDIEGAEWDSMMAAPDEVLERIDQMPMELHNANWQQSLDVIRKLKRTFYVVSLHFNNQACDPAAEPYPSWAFQVLLVNKRLGALDAGKPGKAPGDLPDAPDDPNSPDCQLIP
jgi:hypothetical protein